MSQRARFEIHIPPPAIGWLVVGLFLWMAAGEVRELIHAHKVLKRFDDSEARTRAAGDSLNALIKAGRCVWIAPRDTVANPRRR